MTLNLSGGTPTSVAIASVASHGTATASGTAITYTPVTGFFGPDSFTYTAANGFGTSSAATVSVTVNGPAITVTPTTLPNGVGLVAYSQTLTASGGQAPYIFSTTVASGALPVGFTLSSAGVVSGTAAVTGTYTFTVTGTDSSTLSHASFTSTTITLNINSGVPLAPGIPTIGTATAGNAQAAVTFSPPASNGGAVITSYTVTSSPSGITATGAASPITVAGLTNGVPYTFTVAATNSAGTGLSSLASNSVTPIAAPIAGATSAVIAYGTSADVITLNLTGGAPTSVAVVAQASHGTAAASGTTITYTPTSSFYGNDTFTFNATNGTGTSATATATITINGPIITITPTTLTSDTVGSTYSQSLSGNGGQAPYTFSAVLASGSLPAGLALSSTGAITGTPTAAGTSTFTVTGTDSSTPTHASFTSTAISLTISAVLAGAPTIGTATAGDAQATVTFTPPASNGGSAITGYTVTSSPGGVAATGVTSPITVTGLANGTTYTFTVTATNAAGVSSASSASNAVTPMSVPIAGATSATVAYDSIATSITLALSGGAPTSVAVASAASHGTAIASGTTISYTPATGYFGGDSFTYTATNAAGISSAGTVSLTVAAPTILVMPTTLPSATLLSPYSQTLVASGGQAPYTFSTTLASGSLPAGLTLSSAGTVTGTPTAVGTSTFTVTGTDSSTLTHATFTSGTITLTVTALLPGAPTIGTATAGNGQASVTFTAPASTGGSQITGYTVTSSPGNNTGTGTASPITVAGLSNGTAYTFTVTATNIIGTGAASAPTVSVTPLAPPIGAASSSTVAYDSTASPITLNLSGGAAASVAVASAASHGTATASGASITYTPVAGFFGPDSFTYTATNASGTSSAATASITISAPVISVTPVTLAAGTVGTAYSQSLSASGGQAPYTFALATGALATGLSFSSSGAITGTPTGNGSFTFTVSGTDSSTATHASFTSGSITLTIGSGVPGAPTIGTATAGNAQASVAFTAPASNGGSAITSYTVTSSPGGLTGTGAASPITVAGLANGTAYTFTVTATNSTGTGTPSAASNSITPKAAQTITFVNPGPETFGTTPTLIATSTSGLTVTFTSTTISVCTITAGGALALVTTGTCIIAADQAGNGSTAAAPEVTQTFTVSAGTPGAPSVGTATAGNDQATVTFTAPASNGGSAITGYTVTSSPGGVTATGTASPITVTGLTDGTAYTFTVTATNATGTGTASAASNSITPKGPQTITFANPGSQGFNTTPTLTATATSSLAVTFTSTTTGVCTITSGGTVSFVTLGTCTIAADQAGNTSYLAATEVTQSFTVNPTVPGAPTIGTATAGNLQATVTFTPGSTGGSPLTGYTVTANPGGITAIGLGSPVTVTGLTNGTAYTFTVTATNLLGTSAPSAPSNAVTPSTLPVAGAVSATVAYNSTADPITLNLSGGAALSVAVASAPSHGTATASGTTITYTPATSNYGPDSFTYTATNLFGTSSPATVSITVSAPVISVTPATLAAGTVGTAYSQALTAVGGKSPYSFSTIVASGALPGGLTLSAAGLISGVPAAGGAFTFTVSGVDSSTGSGPASFTSSTLSLTIAAVLPGAPAIGTATPGNAQASVSFTPPASNGGSNITSYTVTSSPGGLTATGTGSPIIVAGLTNGTAYTFTVTATNSTGTGTSSAVSNSITPGAAPIAGAASATVTYGSTANAVALALSGGTATSVAVASAASHGTATASGTSISYTPTAGYYGSDSFTYTATSASGTSAPATVSITVSAPTITVAPATLTAGTDGSVYTQTLTASGGQAPYTFSTTLASGSLPAGLSLSAAGVISGSPSAAGTFTFTVSGIDSSTATPANFTSATLSLTIAAILPGAPIAGTAMAGNAQATVAFTPPASLGGDSVVHRGPAKPQVGGGDPPVMYTATSSPGGVTGSNTASPILVTGLTNGTTYTFVIAATNSAGTGPVSAATNAVTPQASQTITFANPGPQSFNAALTLTATSTSALPVMFTSSTAAVCTVTSGGAVTFVSGGTCTINANQAGDAAFSAATQVSESFNISATVPGTLLAGVASAGNGQSTVYFTAPTSNGGSGIISYTVTSSPGGLTATGTGSPITVSGLQNGTTYTFTITATNAAGMSLASSPSNSVVPSASVTATQGIASTSLTQNHAATAFTPVLGGSGVAPLTYTISPALPTGLGFSATTGTITGTPTVASAAATYAITVTDASLAAATASFSLTVNTAVVATPGTAPPTVTEGALVAPFTPITGSGGTVPFTYSISPALPAGLSINPATGQITGTPLAASPDTLYTVTITDANGATSTATFNLGVISPLVAESKSVTATYNSTGTTSTAIDLTSAITGGVPTGVTVAASPAHGSATVSGLIVTYTPTQGYYGTDSFNYTATAGAFISSLGTVSITIPAPTISAGSVILPGGAIGVAYARTILPSGGAAPYTFSAVLSSGTLPAGLTLSSAGVISGTPSAACTCVFTVTGTDSSSGSGGPVTFTLTLSLSIAAGVPTVVTITPNLGLAAGGTSVTITGALFTDTSLVSFGSVPANSVAYVNATTLMAIVPAGSGVVDVVVTSAAGSSPTSPADQFTYLAQAGALSDPLGTAADGDGNAFIADPTLGYIVEVPAGCTSITCEKIVGSGLTGLTGVAVDGNGNLFALSGGPDGTVTELTYNSVTSTYVQQTTAAAGLALPNTTPTGITVDDMGNLFVTDTATHQIVEEPYNNATGTYAAPIVLATGSTASAPSGIAVDANGDVFYADPGTGTIDELVPGSSTPIVLASGVNAESVTIDAAGNLYYTDSVANTVTKIPFDGTSYGTPVVIANGLSTPYGLSVDDNGNLVVANNGTRALVNVTVTTPPSLAFANTKVGATSSDSPETATLSNIGTAALTFPPTSVVNPTLTSGYVLAPASTCPQLSYTSSAQTVAEGASCTYSVSFSPVAADIGTDSGSLTATDDNLNMTGATQAIPLTGIALADDASSVSLTLTPASPIVFGKPVAISATVRDTAFPAIVPTGSVTFTGTGGAFTESTVALTNGSASTTPFTPPAAGTYTVTGSYTGVVGDIASSSGNVTLVVTRATPSFAYAPSPATQTFGAAIAAGSLDATAIDSTGATISGTFAYSTSVASTPTNLIAGTTVLPDGTYTITATFTPADTANYASGTVTAAYSVTKATQTIVYAPSPAIQSYGTAITAGSLDATAVDGNGRSIPGTFLYSTSVGSTPTILVAGTTVLPAATYSILATFTPTDASDYISGGTATAVYTVTPEATTITLSNLSYAFDGQPHSATVTTTPANLNITTTYNGSATPPSAGGSYAVVATIHEVDYSGVATGTLVIAKVSVASVTLVASPNPVLTTTPVTLTATVTSPLGTPTGTVNFMDTANGVVFDSEVLVNGVATLTTNAEPLGVYNLVAVYLGDTNLLPLTSPVFVSTVLNFTVSLSTADGSASTATADPGGSASYQFTITPDGSTTFTEPVTFSISGQPSGSTYTITPSVIPAGDGPTPVMLSITLPQDLAGLHGNGRNLAPLALAMLLLPFARRMRRTAKRLARTLTLLLLLAAGIGGATGCGPASGFLGGGGHQSKTYNIILTGKSGALTHSTTVILNVP